MAEVGRAELARQVVVGIGAGMAAGYAGPLAGTAAAGMAPAVLAGMDYISAAIGARRIQHATETLTDAADAFGAQTPEEFVDFVEAAISDEGHQELLARALTIAQDTAMRDKRRALGRALASATSDTGTKVDAELLFIRILADLDEPHIRLLKLLSTEPPLKIDLRKQSSDANQWYPWLIARVDPGLGEIVPSLITTLSRHNLVRGTNLPARDFHYAITANGEMFLTRLADPA